MQDNKKIAKNTIFLYIRMILIMGVTIYTSRVVLDKLGVDDFALYNVVGGIAGMLSFLSATLSIGTSRFITYELGACRKDRLMLTFTTAFYTHLILASIIVFIMETGGIWFLYNKLVIPPDRMQACFWVMQISIVATVISIVQVPYTSSIMSYERMDIYAYVSIFEAFGKLGICYVLTLTSSVDKLILYAGLIATIQLIVALLYYLFCKKTFDTCQVLLKFDKSIFRSLLSFSGWNILANLTETLKLQGVVIIINMFLNPVVVAAQSLSNQISSAMMQFVNSFRTAINPQIIKSYASGERAASKKLTIETTVYCFDLVLIMSLPCIYTMKMIMGLWLVEVPEYAVIFAQYALVYNIIGTFGAAFYVPMMAANKIKTNSLAALVLGVGQFVILYFILKFGGGPMWIQYMSMIMCVGFSLIVKPYVLWKEIDYSISELATCYWTCLKVLLLSLLLSLPLKYVMSESILHGFILIFETIVAVAVSSCVFMEKGSRKRLIMFVKSKLHIIAVRRNFTIK